MMWGCAMRRTLQWLQPGLNLLAVRFQERRQHQRLAKFVERLVHPEAWPVGGNLEQNAVPLAEIQRVKTITVDLAAVRDAHLLQLRGPGLVVPLRRAETDT